MTFACRGCGKECEGRSVRIFCSLSCQRDSERRAKVQAWLTTGQAPYVGTRADHYVRRHLFSEQSGRCAICGLAAMWNGRDLALVLDHIDGDASNNARPNLRLICPNCDSQLATYKSRNRGNGRHMRRQRYAEGRSY